MPRIPSTSVSVILSLLATAALSAAGCDSSPSTPAEEASSIEAADDNLAPAPRPTPVHPRLTLTAYDPPTSLEEIPEGVNAVQVEMQFLTAAMHNILIHISDANLAAIPEEIGKVHPLYDLTHSAIEQGLYTLPYNSDQLEEFERVDNAFHDDLRALVAAAREDDLDAAAKAYGTLVEGCVSCHAQFRFAPTEGE